MYVPYVLTQTLTPSLNATYRCLAHIVHLAAKHIIQAFSASGPVMEPGLPEDTPADLDKDSETSYASGDLLGKLWAFINQVSGHLLRAWGRTWCSIRMSTLYNSADLVCRFV